MTEKTRAKSPATVTFGLTTNVLRKGWPTHGSFRLQEGDESATSRDMFSVDACREHIKLSIEDGHLNSDQAANLEREILAAGLPIAKNRYDKISEAFGRSSEYRRLIGQFCGALPPEEGSGPARFEMCGDSQFCGLESCEELPSHFQLFPKGITSGFSNVVFSQQGATALLKQAVENGLLLQEEADGLTLQLAEFNSSSEAERADKLSKQLTGELLAIELEVALGFRQRVIPPHFSACGQHYHLQVDDNVLSATRLENEFDAKLVLDGLTEAGLLSGDEHTKLLDDLAAMHLPPGNMDESVFNPSSIPRDKPRTNVIESFFSLFSRR